MSSTLFDQMVKQRVGFAIASDLDDVPEDPGIYAWYLPMRGDSTSDLLQYLKTLMTNIEGSIPATAMSGEGMQRRFRLERNPPVFDLAAQPVQRLSERMTSSQLQALASAVLILSLFTEPIYVGMTEADKGLKSRLQQHLLSVKSFDADTKWKGAFRTRIAKILQDPTYLRRCLIAYMPIPSGEMGEDAARVIEHILIRTIRPAQSVRG